MSKGGGDGDTSMHAESESESESESTGPAAATVATQLSPLYQAIEGNTGASNNNNNQTEAMVKLLSNTQQRQSIIQCVESTKFHKNHARRVFASIGPVLRDIIEEELYVPASAFDDIVDEGEGEGEGEGEEQLSEERQSEDDESKGKGKGKGERRESSKRQSQESAASASASASTKNVTVVPDAESTEAMQYMKYTALLVQAYITNLMSRRTNLANSSGNGNGNGNGNRNGNSKCTRTYDILKEVWEIVDLLHETLFSLHSCGTEGLTIQRTIISLCEAYWNGHFVQREEFITRLIPLLVLKTLNGNATRADIKRLWNVREALTLLNFDDVEGMAHLRSFLLRTASSPLYVKHVEGRKMMAYLFQLDELLCLDLHKAIKVQIPMSTKKVLGFYADVYWRAWKESLKDDGDDSEDHRKEDASSGGRSNGHDSEDEDDDEKSARKKTIQSTIEENILQDLMHASVHIASPHMAKCLRTILEPFHVHKHDANNQVEQLLFELYTPFLWRSLSAANPIVRVHASSILARTFPLRDPSKGKIHTKEINDKSIESLLNLLQDDDHKVRVAGSEATVLILSVYWDALSSKDIRSLLHEIVMRHAKDASSSAVRVQAVNGISDLLDANGGASHGVLRNLLPFLGDLIHDRVEKVRLATVRLLLKLKTLKGFKYYHTVPSNHLLARLAEEGEGVKDPRGAVASGLTKLLSNSYFPQGKNIKGSEQMRRTLHFLEENRKAARVFYSNIAFHLEIRSTCKMIAMLVKTLRLAVERDLDSDYEDEEDGVVASNTSLMAGIAQICLILVTAIAKDLEDPDNGDCFNYIQDAMQGTIMIKLCSHFEAKIENEVVAGDSNPDNASASLVNDCHDICASLLGCAGFITSDNRKKLQSQLSGRLEAYSKLSRNERGSINVIPYLAVFCSWGMEAHVFKALSASVSSVFADEDTSPHFSPVLAKRGKRKQSSNNHDTSAVPQLPGEMAVHIIAQILRGGEPSSLAIRDALTSSEDSSIGIANALEKATIAAENIINGSLLASELDEDTTIELILSACESFGRLSMHKAAHSDETLNLSHQTTSLLRWLTKRAIPALISKTQERSSCSPFRDLNLSRISSIGIRDSVSPTPLSPLGVPPPRRRSNMNCTPLKVDSSFMSMEHRGGNQYVIETKSKGSYKAHVMVIALLKSAFTIFSEWLTLGGGGVDLIAENVVEWKKIFQCDTNEINAARELFPSYCRFGAILSKHFSRYDLLREVIMSTADFDKCDVTDDCVKSTIISLLSTKSTKDAVIIELVKALFHTLKNDTRKPSMPVSLEDCLEEQASGVKVAFNILLLNERGVTSLADMLSKCLSVAGESDNTSFHETLLIALCEQYISGSMKENLKNSVLQHITADGNQFRGVKQSLGLVV